MYNITEFIRTLTAENKPDNNPRTADEGADKFVKISLAVSFSIIGFCALTFCWSRCTSGWRRGGAIRQHQANELDNRPSWPISFTESNVSRSLLGEGDIERNESLIPYCQPTTHTQQPSATATARQFTNTTQQEQLPPQETYGLLSFSRALARRIERLTSAPDALTNQLLISAAPPSFGGSSSSNAISPGPGFPAISGGSNQARLT